MDAAVQCVVHHTIAHIQCFSRSHWMPLLGKCLRCMAPAAIKVIDFRCKHKNTNKTQLLASKLTVDRSQKLHQFCTPKQTLYSRHQCNKLRKKCEITNTKRKSLRTFSAIKRCQRTKIGKVIKLEQSLLK